MEYYEGQYEDQGYWEQPEEASYSPFSEFIVLSIWVFLFLEGIFFNYISSVTGAHNAIWTKITPYKLFPSELFFYGPVLLMSASVVMRGRRFGYRNSRGIWLLVLILSLGALQALHGKISGALGNVWLADFRQMYLMMIFVPFFNILASEIRLLKVLNRFCIICTILGFYNAIMGLLLLTGGLVRGSLLEPRYSGEFIMMIAYIFVMVRSIVTGKNSKIMLMILAAGIVAPLHKPALAGFVFVNFVMFCILLFYNRNFDLMVYLRSVKMISIIGAILFLLLPWMLTLGGGEGKRWLARRFLKTDVSAASRDITSGRLHAYRWAFDQWKAHPFIGTGCGIHLTGVSVEGEASQMVVHNLPLTVLYQTGLTGFVLCFIVLIIWFKRISNYFKYEGVTQDNWPLLVPLIWSFSMLLSTFLGRTLGITLIGFMFWSFVGILNNMEMQYVMGASSDMDYHDDYSMYQPEQMMV